MNKSRRKTLTNAMLQAQELKNVVANILSDEQQYLDNVPENLQATEAYSTAEAAVDALEGALEALESLLEYLADAAE